jgi:hypothetical protein
MPNSLLSTKKPLFVHRNFSILTSLAGLKKDTEKDVSGDIREFDSFGTNQTFIRNEQPLPHEIRHIGQTRYKLDAARHLFV